MGIESVDEIGRGGTSIKQIADMLSRATHGIQRRDPLQGIATMNVEDHRVPGCCGYLIGEPSKALTAEVGPSILRGTNHRLAHCRLRRETEQGPSILESIRQPLVWAHIAVLQVNKLQTRVIPLQSVPIPISIQDAEFRDPVQLM